MSREPTRVALITGASQGLGREIARQYAQLGFRLVLTARGEDALSQVARELESVTEVLAVPVDVADAAATDALVAAALERFGHIDILINNASDLGPTPMPALETFPLEALRRVVEVNLIAPLHLTQLVLPGMKQNGGIIVNVTSDAGVEAYPGWGGYGASKAGLEHLSRTLAAELEGTGITIYAVDPGDMNTQMHRDAEPGADLSELPTPDKVAPGFVRLVLEGKSSGRFTAQDLMAEVQHAGS